MSRTTAVSKHKKPENPGNSVEKSVPQKQTLRVAMVSMKTGARPRDEMLKWMRSQVEKASESGAQFIGFPEAALTGYTFSPMQTIALNDPSLKEVESWARSLGVWIGVGFFERSNQGCFNTIGIYGPAGRVGFMRKIDLVGAEKPHVKHGAALPVFDVAGCKMGVTICADGSYYENFRILSLNGAEVIFAPHANSLGIYGNDAAGWNRWRMENWPTYVRENIVAVAGVNTAGQIKSPVDREPAKFCGGALVMDHQGGVIKRHAAHSKLEAMLIAQIDLTALRESRAKRQKLIDEKRWEMQVDFYYKKSLVKKWNAR